MGAVENSNCPKSWVHFRETNMKKYACDICGWIYDEAEGDPDNGYAAGTKWEALPADFECPVCGADKDSFSLVED